MRFIELHCEVAIMVTNRNMRSCRDVPPHMVLDVEWRDWLGSDILMTFPLHFVTERLARRLEQSTLSGFVVSDRLTVRETQEFQMRLLTQYVPAPKLLWLQVNGAMMRDDFALDEQQNLFTSLKAFGVLMEFNMFGLTIGREIQCGADSS